MWKKYDDEFKRNALQKVFDGQSVRSVAEELGVNESLIHKWKRTAKTNGDGTRSGAELTETAELKKGDFRPNPRKLSIRLFITLWIFSSLRSDTGKRWLLTADTPASDF